MLRVSAFIILGLFAAGCTAHKTTRVPLAANASAMSEMQGTNSMVQKRGLASLHCRKAGYRKRTGAYYQCMRALIARDGQRTRDRAEFYAQQAAERGACLNQETFRVARCLEI